MSKLAIMCGLPRSGKTTYARRMERHGWVRVSPDDIRLALHATAFNELAEPYVWAIAETMARALLLGGRDVLIDATNTTVARRKQWVAVARSYDLTLEINFIPTPDYVCLRRRRRNEAVPDEVIARMWANFERPTRAEGIVMVPIKVFEEEVTS